MIYEQNISTNEKDQKVKMQPKGNFGTEKWSNWHEKLTRGIQKHAEEGTSELEHNTMEIECEELKKK